MQDAFMPIRTFNGQLTMKKQPTLWLTMIVCTAPVGLSSCQSLLEGPAATPPAACSTVNDESLVTRLEKENARLKKQLADSMQDNATLRDLAAKKW